MVVLPIEYIVRDPQVMGGKPRIAGQRVSVEDIIMLHQKPDWPVERIAEELDLTLAQIYAALSYYFDHRTEIDASIAEALEFVPSDAQSGQDLRARIEARREDMQNDE